VAVEEGEVFSLQCRYLYVIVDGKIPALHHRIRQHQAAVDIPARLRVEEIGERHKKKKEEKDGDSLLHISARLVVVSEKPLCLKESGKQEKCPGYFSHSPSFLPSLSNLFYLSGSSFTPRVTSTDFSGVIKSLAAMRNA